MGVKKKKAHLCGGPQPKCVLLDVGFCKAEWEKQYPAVCVCVWEYKHVHVKMTTVFFIYDPHLCLGCQFFWGAEGRGHMRRTVEGKKEKKKKKLLGNSGVSAVLGPLAFMAH